MNSPKLLVLFVDAYPFYRLEEKLAASFERVASLTPGLGYSINCQAELFTGQSPDQLGFWCDWARSQASPFRRWAWALRLVDLSRSVYVADRVAHKVIDRFARQHTKDIPFKYLQFFAHTPYSVFDRSFPGRRFFEGLRAKVLSYRDFPGLQPGELDQHVGERALAEMEAGEFDVLLPAFGELDSVGHFAGLDAEAYSNVLGSTGARLLRLVEAFESRFPGSPALVLSDHGMSTITTLMRLGLEEKLGPPSAGRYTYFAEATIFRAWSADAALRADMAAMLAENPRVRVLSPDDRKREGLLNPAFGDVIAACAPGSMWVPSFWGPKPSLGMHGYEGTDPHQQGIFLARNLGEEVPAQMHNREVYGILDRLAGRMRGSAGRTRNDGGRERA